MIVYRLALPKYANDLSGMGSALYGGRWNSIGNFILYTGETSSLSILEHLVHITGAPPMRQYTLTQIDLKSSAIGELEITLPENWSSNEKITNRIGDDWIKNKTSPVLKVPSAINPLENNVLINPNHPELKIEVSNQDWFVYDRRLIKKIGF